jgi:hypothetical protein
MTIGESGIQGGTSFGYGDPNLNYHSSWEIVQGNFSLTTEDGEAFFLYCMNSYGMPKPLVGFSNKAVMAEDGSGELNETATIIPESLLGLGFQEIVPHSNNLLFNRTSVSDGDFVASDEWKEALRDPAYWDGDNETRFSVESSPAPTAAMNLVAVASGSILATVWMTLVM